MRYSLHLCQSDRTVRDPEGSEHSSLDAVRLEAVQAAREMMANAVRVGRDISDWSFEIAGERDASFGRVEFASVVSRSGSQDVARRR